jgi:hypothetical protein
MKIVIQYLQCLSDSPDYELKYEPDELFHEIESDARIWKVYNDEADFLDREMLEGAEDSLDILLIFVCLLKLGLIILLLTLIYYRRRCSQPLSQRLS